MDKKCGGQTETSSAVASFLMQSGAQSVQLSVSDNKNGTFFPLTFLSFSLFFGQVCSYSASLKPRLEQVWAIWLLNRDQKQGGGH